MPPIPVDPNTGIELAPERINDEALARLPARDHVYKIAVGHSLYLWIFPNGSKLWRLRFRLRDESGSSGKPREYAVGPFGFGKDEYTLDAAQNAAEAARELIAHGIDPVQARQRERVERAIADVKKRAEDAARHTAFSTVAEAWFSASRKNWSESHRKVQRARLDNEILPVIGNKPIGSIDAPTVLALLRRIEKRGTHEVLKRVRIIISQVLRYAIANGLAKEDVTPATRDAFVAPPVEHRATIPLKEFPALFKAVNKVPSEAVTKLALAWVQATCCRTNEMRYGTHDEIDAIEVEVSDGKKLRVKTIPVWRVPAARMKMKVDWLQPLSPLALKILERARELRTGDEADAYLFPGFSRGGALSENALLALLARAGYFGRQTGHGFRAAFSTWAHERFSADALAVELCLAHRPGGVLGAYHRAEHIERRLAILTAWGEHLERLGLKLP